jgi:Ca-activated chloride channel family protein
VKADWGQRIQAQVTIPQLGAATRKAVDVGRYLDLDVISPTGEDVYAVFAKKVPGGAGKRGVLDPNGTVKAITTKEIRYLNRDGANNQDTGTSLPGEYYLAVSMTRKTDDKAFAIPMTLTVGLVGTAGTGKPQYVDGATPVDGTSVTPSPTAEPTDTGSKPEAGGPVRSASSDSGSNPPVALIAGLGGGGLALLLVGLLLVLRLRRRPAVVQPSATNWHNPNQPPQYPNQPPRR